MPEIIPTPSPFATEIPLPNPEAIRAAIDVADERALLLRRLLRVALRLQLHLPAGSPLPLTKQTPGEVARA